MASSSYSAIKIPVPGNLIDTPNAQTGDLLRYNNGVYSNFRPLIVDLYPTTNNKSLEFRVSVGSDGSYDTDTEAGMYLHKVTSNGANKDFSLTINAVTMEGEGRATLDVNGNFALGQTNPILFPNGATRPINVKNKFVSVLKSDGTIEFKFLDSIINQMDDDDNTIHVSGNSVEVNRDELAQTLYTAKYGVQIPPASANDGVSGGVIEADLQWLRTNSTDPSGQYSSEIGGLFKVHGGLSLTNGEISIDGSELAQWFSNGEGITLTTVDETLKIDTNIDWLLGSGNLFTYGQGISNDSGTLNTTTKQLVAQTHDGPQTALGLATVGGSACSHVRIEGRGAFYVTGGWDVCSGTCPVEAQRWFTASFRPMNGGALAGEEDDGGGIEILTSDKNNDEFSIKCENLRDAELLPVDNASQWHLDSGLDTTAIPLTASHHPLFYVKSTSGAMYNSSSYFTEGRILIGQNDELVSAGMKVDDMPRTGASDMPNVPAHLSIFSTTPTILLHQTTMDTTAPTILMTSKDPGNMTAFGPSGGTENAATWISNRDGEILNIEMTTTYMTSPVFDPKSKSPNENRFHAANRAHVWSLDYYYDTATDDGEIEYCYMRLGATSAGSHYLPVSDTGLPPVGMRAGGFWLDTSEANGSTTNPTVRCTLLGDV
jgi:hypothetical protein